MELSLASLLWTLIVVLTTVFVSLYVYFRYAYTYWKKKGVVYLEPSFPFGNITDTVLQKKPGGKMFEDAHKKLDGHDFGGIFAISRPILLVRNPELIKNVLVKSFANFQDHGTYFDEKTDPLSAHLFTLTGQKWRNLRIKLSPTFTSGKIKTMFSILTNCGKGLGSYLEKNAQDEIIEVKDILAKFTTDIIASFAFGVECNCLTDPEAEFRKWGTKIFEPTIKNGLRSIFMFVSPTISSILKIPFVPKDITHYFRNMVKETIEYREKNNVKRNDFMQLLIQLKNQGEVSQNNEHINGNNINSEKEPNLSLNDVAAQALIFFIGGFETSSTTMSFSLYELALNPDIQKRVHLEIDNVLKKHNNEITYEAIQEMTYLDMVVSETLRKYPPAAFIPRECTQDYQIPGTNVVIEKGTAIIISNLALHHDPKYYPNPEKFDPERFTDEAKAKRPACTYLPFGEGPRICIGMRFGLLQSKMGLASWLHKNEVQVSDKTPIPITYDPKTQITTVAGGMWLKNVKRNKI